MDIKVNSEPSGATVYVNEKQQCITPRTIHFDLNYIYGLKGERTTNTSHIKPTPDPMYLLSHNDIRTIKVSKESYLDSQINTLGWNYLTNESKLDGERHDLELPKLLRSKGPGDPIPAQGAWSIKLKPILTGTYRKAFGAFLDH